MNIKRVLMCGIAACTVAGAMAIPAKRGVRVFRQADGSSISLHLTGDEFYHTYSTTDGLAVERKADGNFYYKNAQGVTDVVAHNVGLRQSSENAFVKTQKDAISLENVTKAQRKSALRRKAPARKARKASQVPSSGSPRVPVLLVQYKDYKFKDADPNATFTEFFSTGKVSAHQYFVDQSNGKYTPQFDVYGPVTLTGNRSVYGGNDWNGDDKGVGKMVGEGCLALDSQIDFSRYDNDGDGECDVVIVLYAGDGEASSYDEDCEDSVWPCQWELSDSDYGSSLNLDRTLVNKFAVFNELNGVDLSMIDGIGTFCHEFSHCLDLPDFYDTQYGPHFGMADWSLMDYGSYNDDGYTPIGYSAYEKAFMGWIDIQEATENTLYTLPVFNQKNAATDVAVKVTNDKDNNEYYIIENRANQGWDKYMPAEGLLIYHVTYSADAWAGNYVNDYDLQRMTPIPADNSLKLDYDGDYYIVNQKDLLGDLWPYNGHNELTDTSVPAAKVNTGSLMGKPITEITRNADGTISFWAMKAPKPAVATPVSLSHKVESPSSATISWEAGDNENVTYTLEVKQHRDITYELVSSTNFVSNKEHGWTPGSGYTNVEAEGIRLGSTKQKGEISSSAFKADSEGVVTVKFSGKSYGNDQSSVKVSLTDNAGNELAAQTIALSAQPEDYNVVLKGKADATVKVKFECIATKKRVYILSAELYTGDATEADKARRANESGDSLNRTITGITGTSYTVSGLQEGGVYDYRVKAVPVDAETFGESAWTAKGLLDLNSSAVEEIGVEAGVTEYFTLQGVSLGNSVPAEKGVYILRNGSKAVKVLVK